MDKYDPQPKGWVNFQLFCKIMADPVFDRSMMTEDELINAFKIFDKDHSGSIDAIEMQSLMKTLGFPCTAMEAHSIIAEADDDNSGEVTYNEFVNKVLRNQ